MFDYKEARKYTKENINGKASTIFGYAILYIIFKSIISGFLGSHNGFFGVLAPAIVAAATTPIQVGLFRIIINILNNKSVNVRMLFDDYKYILNLFVIGFICNFIITFAYKIYAIGFLLGFLLDSIYVGILYFFVYNSDISLGKFFNKILEKIKLYFPGCVILRLSYEWPLFLVTFIYTILTVIILAILAINNISDFMNISVLSADTLLSLITSFVPILVISIIYSVIIIIMIVRIIPRVLFAEAKFYSNFINDVKTKENFCSNCGEKVKGNFCEKCGTKIKE